MALLKTFPQGHSTRIFNGSFSVTSPTMAGRKAQVPDLREKPFGILFLYRQEEAAGGLWIKEKLLLKKRLLLKFYLSFHVIPVSLACCRNVKFFHIGGTTRNKGHRVTENSGGTVFAQKLV